MTGSEHNDRVIFVDYSRVGYATTFTIPLMRHERAQLEVGDVVTVVGDAVAPMAAKVEAVDLEGGCATLRLLAPWNRQG